MKLDLRHFASVGSTQDICRRLAECGAAEGVTIVADEQTAGRGRVGHHWFSPPGQAIYTSILLRPSLGMAQANWITMIAALAVTDTVAILGANAVGADARSAPTASAPTATIKWFNDVLLGGKKVCGILVETAVIADQLEYAILGIGLNVNTAFGHAPDDVHARASSLREAWGLDAQIDRAAALQLLLAQFDQRYTQLIDTQHSPAPEYAQRMDTLGKWVRVQVGDDIIEGLACTVDDWGGLCIQTNRGIRKAHFGHILSAS